MPTIQKAEIPHYTVIRDSREKVGHGWTFPADGYCDGTIVGKLDTGDYSIKGFESEFVLERKASVSEIVNNAHEKRWSKELDRLDSFRYAFLLFEFEFNDIIQFPVGSNIPKHLWHKVKMSADFLQSCIAKWQVQHSCRILFVGKHGDLAAKKLFHYFMKYGRV